MLSKLNPFRKSYNSYLTISAQDSDPPWLKIAIRELGVSEAKGKLNNKKILEYHSATFLKAQEDKISWCASFVCWCLEAAGVKSTRSPVARSYMKWGKLIGSPTKGCICVFKREGPSWGGHVAFFIAENEHEIFALSGNIGNRVVISPFAKTDLLGYRAPEN